MAHGGAKRPSDDNEWVKLNPGAQTALDELIAKNIRRKAKQRLARNILIPLFLLITLPLPFEFYCKHIIGTRFEEIILRTDPLFTGKMVRATVTLDKWYMSALGPFLAAIEAKEDIDFRKAVIELGLEETDEGGGNRHKISKLRGEVAATLLKMPEPRGKVVAFAVYELPPRKPVRRESP